MANYQVTVGYKAIISIDINAENEADAKEIALHEIGIINDRISKRKGVELQDSTYGADGIVNMDKTWNMVNS